VPLRHASGPARGSGEARRRATRIARTSQEALNCGARLSRPSKLALGHISTLYRKSASLRIEVIDARANRKANRRASLFSPFRRKIADDIRTDIETRLSAANGKARASRDCELAFKPSRERGRVIYLSNDSRCPATGTTLPVYRKAKPALLIVAINRLAS